MGNIFLLDCTLRDGGYVNDWLFGKSTITGFCGKIARTRIEMFEVGFIKGDSYDENRSVFPDTDSFKSVIQPKASGLMYFGMVDMSAPVPLERINNYDGSSIDGIRVIFKKDRADVAFEYCREIIKRGYRVFVNPVGTDQYTEEEFACTVKKFNELEPFGFTIVDTFGLIKRRAFLDYVHIADENLNKNAVLGYHAHNNLQQAFGNAEALADAELDRDICIDACVFGMGRGAGNLNLELFAEYLNENRGKGYLIEPMLEIMDEYLNDIYKTKFWGYSVPLYLSACNGCHPNYAIYFAEKDSLTVKAFNELLKSLSKADRIKFSKEKAEDYYRRYLENYIDDTAAVENLKKELDGKNIVVLAPGKSLNEQRDIIMEECNKPDTVAIAANFTAVQFKPDYIFSSNMRRYIKIDGNTAAKCITTSNMKECIHSDFTVNFASYSLKTPEIIDNSGLMLLKLLIALGIKSVSIAGMDGYSPDYKNDYYDARLNYDFSKETNRRNELIAAELKEIKKAIELKFITPTNYKI